MINVTVTNSTSSSESTNSILKLSFSFICAPLTCLYKLFLADGCFPYDLKFSNVIPLLENNNPDIFNDYRLLLLLYTVSKVFKTIICNRLIIVLEGYQILFSYQFGFRKRHSTYITLMTLMDNMITCLDNGTYMIGIFIYFPKAFDTVDHSILIQKLSSYGKREVQWLGFEVIAETNINL